MDNLNKYKKVMIYLGAFLFPVFLMILYAAIIGIHPFGDTTMLTYDSNNQYVDYLAYFKTIFKGNNNFIYTFSKNLGGDMVGFSAYYLLSPLNLILLFFPNAMLPDAMLLIVIIKIGLCGLTNCYYLVNKYGNKWSVLVFTTSYALCGYTMAYYWNVMWLEGVVLLPLMALGIEKIFINSKKGFLYIFSLTSALITNYYIGYMLCIYSVIYCFYTLILSTNKIVDVKKYKKEIIRYVFASLLSAGLSSFVLIPTFASLQGGKAKFTLSTLEFKRNFEFIDVFSKLFGNTADYSQMRGGLPNIFCGILIVVLLILYFVNSKIKLRDKFASIGILGILLVCFYVKALNLIWHGFNTPAWYPYRYSFVFIFTMIFLAYKSFIEIKEGIRTYHFFITAVTITVGMFILVKRGYEFLDIKYVYLGIVLLLSFTILLYGLKKHSKFKYIIIPMISVFVIVDLSLNALSNMKDFRLDYVTADGFEDYINCTQPVVDEVLDNDLSFYRMEKTFYRKLNDPMQFNYNGLSHFSSSEKQFVKDFIGKLGFRNYGSWAAYQSGSTVSADSLLGVKYLLSKEELDKPYELLFKKNGISVYKNPFALPIGFSVNGIELPDIKDEENVFDFQDAIWKTATGDSSENVFTVAEIIESGMINLDMKTSENTVKYEKIKSDKDAYVTYKIEAKNNNMLYVYMSAPTSQIAEIFVNGQSYGAYFDTFRWYALPIGEFDIGEIVEIKIKLGSDSLEIGHPYFYHENIEVLKNVYSKLSEDTCELEEISSSHLKGQVEMKSVNQYLLLTIPCEKNWKITVDGNLIEAKEAFGALTAISVPMGKHVIECKYVPEGIYVGMGITIVSLLAVVFSAFCKKRLK